MSSAAAALARELERAAAAELARAGELDSAVRMLEQLDGDDPETLDLLARVQAQRGDLEAAESAWQRLLALRPDDPSATAGRRLIAQIKSGRRRRRPLPVRVLGAATAAVLVLVATGGLVAGLPGRDAASGTDPAPPSPPATTGATATDRPSPSPVDSGAVERRGRLQTLMRELAAPGVQLELREHDIRVVFDDGLFPPDGSQLTADGRRRLEGWGARLRGQQDLQVTVVGHSVIVAGGPTTGGSPTALARAAEAAEALASVSWHPRTSFTVAAAEQSATPYSGDTEEVRARNRTVTLLIALAN